MTFSSCSAPCITRAKVSRVRVVHAATDMRFKNREHAAALLAAQLSSYKGQSPLVLGMPRGAVPMARVIASALDGELDVVLVRKLRAPYQAELAIGAIDEAGFVLTGRHLDRGEVSDEYLREEIRTQSEVLRRRRRLYTGTRPPSTATARVVIIVDDGIATGSSMLAAIRSVRAQRPRKIVVAVGVAAPESLAAIQTEADEVVCLQSPEEFYAVGQFFEDFSEVTDDMVVAALAGAAQAVTHTHAET